MAWYAEERIEEQEKVWRIAPLTSAGVVRVCACICDYQWDHI